MNHVPGHVLARYAAGDDHEAGADVGWAVEAHLETCGACRRHLATVVPQQDPATAALVARVHAALQPALATSPRMPPPRRLPTLPLARRRPARTVPAWNAPTLASRRVGGNWGRWWVAPALLPRLVMTVLVVLAALGLDLAGGASGGRSPSLVLLLAPVAPLVGVAASWSQRMDPAYELVVASPRAGLELVLRRTAAVLAVVVPTLAAAGWLIGASPARWLLPCLAFTTAALALGERIGLHRAAGGLAVCWAVLVVGPSLVLARSPALLDPAALPGWAAATALIALALAAHRRGWTALRSLR